MQKSNLEKFYRQHHERGSRYGYLFCNGSRSPYLKKWIGEGKRVLDLGCRDGMLTASYRKGNEVVGVDIDGKALEIAKTKLEIEVCWLDLNVEWPFPPESFDVIVACEIVEHLYVLDSFLKNVYETLKPQGLFIGSVPNAFRMRNRLKFLFGNEYETDPTHVRQFSFHRLRSLLREKFTQIEVVPIGGKILPFLSVHKRVPRAISRLFAKDLLWCAQKRN